MSFAEYFHVLRRHWRVWVVCVLVGLIAATAYNELAPVKYTAKTVSFVTVAESASATSGDVFQGSQFAVQRVKSYAPLGSSPQVLDPVIKKLGLDMTSAELRDMVEVSSPPETVLLEVRAEHRDPYTAVRIADEVSAQLAVRIHDLETPRLRGASLVNVDVTQPAEVPISPSSPRKALDLAIGALVGGALGLMIALLLHHFRRRIDGLDDVREVTGMVPLGPIRPLRGRKPVSLVTLDRRSAAAEEYRTIRSAISLGPEDWRGGFVVSSPSRADGKSTVAANLAISWAQAGASVCLVDADLRDGSIARQFEIESSPGLTGVLSGAVSLDEALSHSTKAGITLLPAGKSPEDPPSLLGSERMSVLVRALRSRFEVVIYDSPAMMSVTDALILSEKIGGLVLVARSGATAHKHLASTVEAVDLADQRLIGVAVTGVKPTKGATGRYWTKPASREHKAIAEKVAPVPNAAAYQFREDRGSVLLPVVRPTHPVLPRSMDVDRVFS